MSTGRELEDDFRTDARSVFEVMPVLNPVDSRIYAEMGIPLNRYRYGKLMIEAVGRRITIRDLVIELIDRHIERSGKEISDESP